MSVVQRYDMVATLLHWLIAILVLANIALGLYFTNSPAAEAGVSALPPLHKSIGLTVLLLSLLRLGWRLGHAAPAPLQPFALLARLVHWLFYFLLIAVPLAGWALVSVSPRNITTVYFGLFRWPHIAFLHAAPVAARRRALSAFVAVHNDLAFLALGLIVLHVVGALYHMLRRDGAIRRILF
jgi:cytochrome b561